MIWKERIHHHVTRFAKQNGGGHRATSLVHVEFTLALHDLAFKGSHKKGRPQSQTLQSHTDSFTQPSKTFQMCRELAKHRREERKETPLSASAFRDLQVCQGGCRNTLSHFLQGRKYLGRTPLKFQEGQLCLAAGRTEDFLKETVLKQGLEAYVGF